MTNKNDYPGKIVVITGTSSGFGRGTALELAKKDVNLVLAARSRDALNSLAEECRALRGQTLVVVTDVSARWYH